MVEAGAFPEVPVDEAKAYLRIGHGEEDELVAGLVRTAAATCEAFTGLMLIERAVSETIEASASWTRLALGPVRAIEAVAAVLPDGSDAPAEAASYAVDVDAAGDGWVRATGQPVRLKIDYRVGLAGGWAEVPEPLRQGVVRLAAHHYTHRSDAASAGAPAAVTALWRPWRRMRLCSRR